MRNQRFVLLNLSLGIFALVVFVRGSFFPHSLLYVIDLGLFPIYRDIFGNPWAGYLMIVTLTTFAIVFLGFLVYSFIHSFKALGKYKFKAVLPLIINIFTVVLLLFMQYLAIFPDFYLNLKDREAVVAMVNSGEIIPKESQRKQVYPNHPYKIYKMQLPPKYSHLSKASSGEINIITDEHTTPKVIVFFNSLGKLRGIPGYTASIYKMDGNEVNDKEIFGVADIQYYVGLLECKKLQDNWFWVDVYEDAKSLPIFGQ